MSKPADPAASGGPDRPDHSVRLVLATRNRGKIAELHQILGPLLDGIELVPLPDAAPDPVEDGETYRENALIKARSAVAFTGLPAISDDSGIAVDALGGAPGVHSARYAGTRDDRDNYELLLRRLEGVEDRSAAFWCAAALVMPASTSEAPPVELVELRNWPGRVLREPRGTNGHGYDPVFAGAEGERSSAELSAAEKNAVSHRAQAFAALLPRVRAALGLD